jgi:DNA-binding transcriptional ArsR family regulator
MDEVRTLPNVAQIGALIGDPVRAAILGVLMDGTTRPAGELAALCGASPQAASAHLARLLDGGLLAVSKQGRHRYYHLRDADVAYAIETLSVAADFAPRRKRRIDPVLQRARRCYDHIAGALGVAICDALVARGEIVAGGDGYAISRCGDAWLTRCGLVPPDSRKPLARPCLDWTERRPHIAGWLGGAIYRMLEADGGLRCDPKSRALRVTARGRMTLKSCLGMDWEK